MARTHALARQAAGGRTRAAPPPVPAPRRVTSTDQVRDVLHGPFQVTEKPDAQWLRGWLVPGEQPVGEVLEVVNRTPEPQFVPVPFGEGARRLLVFDRDRAPLGFVRLARDEGGRGLVYARPGEPVFVMGVGGREDPKTARPFMVRENAGRISLRIGQLTADQAYTVKLWFKPLGGPEVPVADVPLLTPVGGFVTFPTRFREPGTYRFAVEGTAGERLAAKGVYSHGARREELLSVDAAARRYAPVFSLTREEESVPVLQETMLAGLDPDEPVIIKRWNGQEVAGKAGEIFSGVLPYEPGGTIRLDQEKTGLRKNVPSRDEAALSYAVVPDPDDPDLVHVSYDFTYRFDPKAGTHAKPAFASHPFDAEGIIVTMRRSAGEWRPTVVIYRHHLENQTMGMYGVTRHEPYPDQFGTAYTRPVQSIIHTWEHGAVKLPYDKTIRTPDGRPAVFVSKAHAPYPYPGTPGVGGYRVLGRWVPTGWLSFRMFRTLAPFEHAGGGRLFAPAGVSLPGALPYALRKREPAETTEGTASALSGKRGKLPAGTFSLSKTPEEIVTMYVREAEPMATSVVPPEVIDLGYRILGARPAP
jgi:hypothetical protein